MGRGLGITEGAGVGAIGRGVGTGDGEKCTISAARRTPEMVVVPPQFVVLPAQPCSKAYTWQLPDTPGAVYVICAQFPQPRPFCAAEPLYATSLPPLSKRRSTGVPTQAGPSYMGHVLMVIAEAAQKRIPHATVCVRASLVAVSMMKASQWVKSANVGSCVGANRSVGPGVGGGVGTGGNVGPEVVGGGVGIALGAGVGCTVGTADGSGVGGSEGTGVGLPGK